MNEELRRVEEQLLKTMDSYGVVANKLYENEPIEERVARLITLLNKIQEQLNIVEKTLEKLWQLGYSSNNEDLKLKAATKLETVKSLSLKITQARLNLNYHF